MTILVLMSVRDSKLDAFVNLFTSPSRAAGARAFSDVVNDPSGSVFKHPDDYTLYQVGTFDDSTGVVTPHTTPEHVASARSLLAKQGGEETL